MLRRRGLDDERTSVATAKPQITPSVPILIAPPPRPAQFIAEETRQDVDDENLSRRVPPPPPPPSNILEAAAKALLLDEIRDEPAIMTARKLFDDLTHQLTALEMSATTYNVSEDSPSAHKTKGLVIDADLFSIGSLESTDDESDMGCSNSSKSSSDTSSRGSSDSSKDDKMSSSGNKVEEEDVDKEEKIIEIIDETDELDLETALSPRPSAKKKSAQDSQEEGEEDDICEEFKVFMGAAAPVKFAS